MGALEVLYIFIILVVVVVVVVVVVFIIINIIIIKRKEYILIGKLQQGRVRVNTVRENCMQPMCWFYILTSLASVYAHTYFHVH